MEKKRFRGKEENDISASPLPEGTYLGGENENSVGRGSRAF